MSKMLSWKECLCLCMFLSCAMSLNTQLELIKSRMNTLEIRMNIEYQEIKSEVKSVENGLQALNSSYYEAEKRLHNSTDPNIDKLDNEQESKENVGNLSRNETRVLKAFKDQKAWLVASLAGIDNKITEFHMERDLAEENIRNSITDRFEDLERIVNMHNSHVKVLENKFSELRIREIEHEKQFVVFQETIDELKSSVTIVRQDNKDLIAKLQEKDKKIDDIRLEISELREEFRNLKDAQELERQSTTFSVGTTTEPKQTTESLCPQGWHGFTGYCYLFNDTVMLYTEARSFCNNKGGHIVDIQNEEENAFVSQLSGLIYTWIGLTDEETEGRWIWDRTGNIATYTNWRQGQPNNIGNSQHFVLIGGRRPYEQWDDARYDYYSGVVCKALF